MIKTHQTEETAEWMMKGGRQGTPSFLCLRKCCFSYLKWTPGPDTSSLVFSGGQSNIGTRKACCPVRNLTPFTATTA